MPKDESWPHVSVVGAGAVGCYFGGMLARAGVPVMLIGRAGRVDAINREGLFIDGVHVQEVVQVLASTDVSTTHDAEVILLCVKTVDTEEAAKSLAPYVSPGAVVISLQNGVDNVRRIHVTTGIEAIAAVVYVAAEMSTPRTVRHSGRGDLVIGDLLREQSGDRRRAELEQVAALLARAGIPCRISDNIGGELWVKLIMNCAYNAISALSRAKYGAIAANPWTSGIVRIAIEETLAVARAEVVRMPEGDVIQAALMLADAMSDALSSTAQDIARGKRTEIDSLNGYVARRGKELGVPAPVNQTLHALVKLLEEACSPGARQVGF